MESLLNILGEKGGFMKLKLYTLLFTASILVLASCKTAKKMYEKGNYDEAVELAAKKLQKDPDDPKLLDIIQGSYSYAVADHESRIRNNAASNNELKWEWMYSEYASLQRMYDAIYKVPSVFTLVKPVDYSSDLVTYAEKAGAVRYNRGVAFMQRYDKQSYRNAYREFQAALRFTPGDREAILKMNEAYEYAVTNVVILPMQQQGGYVYSSYSVGNNNFDDQLINNLRYNSGSEFVKFYSTWEARGQNIRTDMQVDMQMANAHIGRYDDYRASRKVSREVVIKERIIKPDSVVKEYAWVHANILTTKRTMHSDAVMRIDVRDPDGRWLWSDNVGGSHTWSTEFSTYTGDARALSEADRQLIERRREFAPTETEIMKCMLDQIGNDATWRIKNYFGRL